MNSLSIYLPIFLSIYLSIFQALLIPQSHVKIVDKKLKHGITSAGPKLDLDIESAHDAEVEVHLPKPRATEASTSRAAAAAAPVSDRRKGKKSGKKGTPDTRLIYLTLRQQHEARL